MGVSSHFSWAFTVYICIHSHRFLFLHRIFFIGLRGVIGNILAPRNPMNMNEYECR